MEQKAKGGLKSNEAGAPKKTGGAMAWVKAARPQFFTATIVPIILGSVIAWKQFGNFNWLLFTLAMLGGVFAHAGVDLVNDYFDHTSSNDDVNQHATQFNGGSRVIQNKILTAKQVYKGSLVCFFICVAIGLYINHLLPGNTILYIGIVGVFLSYFYSADPLRIGYTGFGTPAVGIGFGPVMVLGSYYVQAQQLSWEAFLASIPVGILIALVAHINSFADHDADKHAKKMTWPVIYGKQKAMKIYLFLLTLAYVWVAMGVALKVFPLFSLIVFATLPLYIKAVRVAKSKYDSIYELLPACAATIGLHLTIGLLFSGGYVLDKLIK